MQLSSSKMHMRNHLKKCMSKQKEVFICSLYELKLPRDGIKLISTTHEESHWTQFLISLTAKQRTGILVLLGFKLLIMCVCGFLETCSMSSHAS